MTKYYFTTKTDADEVAGFYNNADHETIPDGALETTKEEIDAACEVQAHAGKRICVTNGVIELRTAPSRSHYWKSGKWGFALDNAKASKLREITAAYTAERTTENKGISSKALGGAVIDCRESDVLNIQNLVTLLEAQGKSEYFYKLKDNTSVDCTVAQIKTVLTELTAALLSMWQLKQTLTEQIDAATTAEEIQAIKWEWAQS